MYVCMSGSAAAACYLAALLDACSRRVVGWQLGKEMEIDAGLALSALEKAMASRQPAAGLIHHSDRGVQYACRGHVERLEAVGAKVSLSAKARPRDKAKAESFFRTLKVEEVCLKDYSDFEQALVSKARGAPHKLPDFY